MLKDAAHVRQMFAEISGSGCAIYDASNATHTLLYSHKNFIRIGIGVNIFGANNNNKVN